ncbi:substrate-binding periplasmic protein [Desulfobacter sp.]
MKKFLLVCISIFFSVSALQAKELTLVAGLSLPPYIIQETNSGMEHDIIKEALIQKGHSLKLKYIPFVRIAVDYAKYDGAVTINEASGVKGNYSDVVITYQNYAISLKSKGLAINSVNDLGKIKVVAFQNATKYLGDAYRDAVSSSPYYKEQGKQALQVKMLYSGRTDAIISDHNIFKYFRKKVIGMDTSADLVYHEIFQGTDYKVLFNDAGIRDEFNQGLAEIKASGRYNEIIQSYIN